MLFCPLCSTSILIQPSPQGYIFQCPCSYSLPIKSAIVSSFQPPLKLPSDILGGKEAWENVDSIEERCGKCGNMRAYFRQVQIRSADEPMTIFFKCQKEDCGFQWTQN